MQATNIRTIREDVIRLLRVTGSSVIEATDLWDNVYSTQYHQARPGVPHTWIFGEYELEFTKQDTCPTQPVEQQDSASPGLFRVVVICAILTILTLILLIGAKSAHALEYGHKYPVAGSKVTPIVETVRKVEHKDCNYPGWHPQPWYYLDGDGPEDTAYADYLEDLGWWHEQYPTACPIAPEPFVP